MAAGVHVQLAGSNNYIINVRGGYTTTDSSSDLTDHNILDISTLTGPMGYAPTKLKIYEIWWTISGYDGILIKFDRGTDYPLDYFQGQGYMDYKPYGGKVDLGSGGTGDLLMTTYGGTANAAYSFQIVMRLKN